MNNTLTIVNYKRNILKFVLAALCFVLALFLLLLGAATAMALLNYDGRLRTVNGTVKSSRTEGDSVHVTLYDSEDNFILNGLRETGVSAEDAAAKFKDGTKVEFTVPQNQLSYVNIWVYGIKIGDEELVPAKKGFAESKKSNDVMLIVSGIGTGVLIAGIIATLYIRGKMPKTMECPYTEKLAQMYGYVSVPLAPARKKMNVWIIVWLALFLIGVFPVAILGENGNAAFYITLGIWLAIAMSFFVAAPFLVRAVRKKEAEFFADGFPVDRYDISHIKAKPEILEEIKKNNESERLRFQNKHHDAGNGLAAEFFEGRLRLYEYGDEENTTVISDNIFEGVSSFNGTYLADIAYSSLDFFADPHYSPQGNMLTLFIVSRLPESYASAKIEHDLVFFYDLQIKEALEQNAVSVEGLFEILSDVKGNILKNCTKNTLKYSGAIVGDDGKI